MRGKGIPYISPCPIKKKPFGSPIIGHPFVITDASPRAAVRVPKVIIKGGTLSFVTKSPCQSPIREDIINTDIIANIIFIPSFINKATKTPVRATKEPTDKSIPPSIIIKVSPIANNPKIATSLAITWRLKILRNLGLIIAIIELRIIRAIKILISLNLR